MATTRPVILKGKARATELLAKMKAAVVSQQGDVPDEDSHEVRLHLLISYRSSFLLGDWCNWVRISLYPSGRDNGLLTLLC